MQLPMQATMRRSLRAAGPIAVPIVMPSEDSSDKDVIYILRNECIQVFATGFYDQLISQIKMMVYVRAVKEDGSCAHLRFDLNAFIFVEDAFDQLPVFVWTHAGLSHYVLKA